MTSRSDLTRSKKILFSVFIAAIPFVFFTSVELFLRLVQYGPNLSLFTTEVVNGTTYHIMNRGVTSRYFREVHFQPTTSPDYFLVPKPASTYRIFCLGGSTTVGYPYWYNGSFSTFLRDRLSFTFPEKSIEVINLGMTATNSFTVLDMAREVIDFEPDLILVYDGHNEFYGALGVASHETLGPSRTIAQCYLRLIHLKTFHLLRDIVEWTKGLFITPPPDDPRMGTMMERMAVGQNIPYHDPRYDAALDTFRENLADLKDLAGKHRIPLIVTTQVSNLMDHPPFISGQPAGASVILENAERLHGSGKVDSALTLVADVLRIDSTSADAHFLAGKAQLARRRFSDADAGFVAARDFDQLRFRTSSDFNHVLSDLHEPPHVFLVDMENEFRLSSPHGLIGFSLITEHLHPNSRGYFLMGKAYASAMRQNELLASAAEWAAKDTTSDSFLWANRVVTELDELLAERRTQVLTAGWPFKQQYPVVDRIPESDTLRTIAEQASRGQLNWLQAHRKAAGFYLGRGDTAEGEAEFKAILNQIPTHTATYIDLAHIYVLRGDLLRARIILMQSLKTEATAPAYRALGDIALRQGRSDEAVSYYTLLLQFPQTNQQSSENRYLLALAYLRSQKIPEALTELDRVLLLDPNNDQARLLREKIRQFRPQ